MKSSTKFSTGFAVCLSSARRRVVAGAALWLLCWVGGAVAETANAEPEGRLQARAEAGEPWAQLNLGAAYDHGIGGYPRDPARAVAWYRRAAEAGVAQAQFNLAHCLATGHGAAPDEVEARDWMAAAARQGLADAQFLLGVMLAEGMGGAADRRAAIDWLARAAAQGHAEAGQLHQALSRSAPQE